MMKANKLQLIFAKRTLRKLTHLIETAERMTDAHGIRKCSADPFYQALRQERDQVQTRIDSLSLI